MKQSVAQRTYRLLAHPAVFWAIVGLLVLQASWIAITSLYPMAFDEDFHLGIIKLYAHHPSPFWAGQPFDADSFGSIATDPSYFYHFLMSFPYRLISALTSNFEAQIITLRLLNVAMFAVGLWLWRKVLRRAHATEPMIHVALAFLVLLPMTSLLAAQINYDNLIFPLTALVLLLTSRYLTRLSTKHIPLVDLFLVISVGLCASLVKYAFLPILLVLAIWVIWTTFARIGGFRKIWKAIMADMKASRLLLITASAALALVFVLLFVQRDVVNVVHYHTPVPDCAKVLSVKECSAYAPWNRDYLLKITKTHTNHNPVIFAREWFYGMWLRSLFAVAGPTNDFTTRGPLIIPGLTVIAAALVGTVAILLKGWQVLRRGNATLRLVVTVAIVYVAVLWLDEFEAYVRTGQPVAINGRYLIPVALPLLVWCGMSLSTLMGKRRELKLVIAALLVIGLSIGGGALTYVLRSEPGWYWHSPLQTISLHIKTTVGPLIPGYQAPTQFLR